MWESPCSSPCPLRQSGTGTWHDTWNREGVPWENWLHILPGQEREELHHLLAPSGICRQCRPICTIDGSVDEVRAWWRWLLVCSLFWSILKHLYPFWYILIYFDTIFFPFLFFFPTDNGEECSQVLPSCHLWYIAFLSNVAASHIFPHSDWYKNNQEYTRSIKINGMVLCGSTMFYHKLQYISVYYIVLLYDMLWSLCCDLHSQSVSHWFTKHHRTIQNHTKPIKSWSVFCTSIGTVGSPDFSSLPSIILHPRFSNRRMTNFKFLAVFFTLQSSSSCQLVWMRWH